MEIFCEHCIYNKDPTIDLMDSFLMAMDRRKKEKKKSHFRELHSRNEYLSGLVFYTCGTCIKIVKKKFWHVICTWFLTLGGGDPCDGHVTYTRSILYQQNWHVTPYIFLRIINNQPPFFVFINLHHINLKSQPTTITSNWKINPDNWYKGHPLLFDVSSDLPER